MRYVPVFDEPTLAKLHGELARASRRAKAVSGAMGELPATRMQDHVKRFARQLRRIRGFVETGAHARARVEMDRALRSHHAKIAAILLHNGTCVADEIEEKAARIDLFKSCNDPIRVSVEPKENGGHRLIHHPGWRHRSRQWIVRSVLLEAGFSSEFDVNTKGIGAARALKAIQADATENGYRYWAIADIKNCYSTVKLGHLREILPIDADALSSVILTEDSVPVLLSQDGNPIHDSILEKEARLGVAKGSKLSPLLASVLLGGQLRALALEANPAMSFVDDIAIGARVRSEAQGFNHALSKRLLSLKAGPLQLKHARVYDAREGIIYLRRKIRLRCWDGEVHARMTLSASAYAKMYRKAVDLFAGALGKLAQQDEPNDLDVYIAQSLRGYSVEPSDAAIYEIKTRMLLRSSKLFA